MQTTTSLSVAAVLVISSCVAVLGCESSVTTPPPRVASTAAPAWSGALADQFDDNIESWNEVVSMRGRSLGEENFVCRARAADHVVRVKVITRTRERAGDKDSYRLTLRVLGQPLSGGSPPADQVEVVIAKGTPAYNAVAAQLVGSTGSVFIGFFKQFSGPDRGQLHWHLQEEDSSAPDVAAREVRSQGEGGG